MQLNNIYKFQIHYVNKENNNMDCKFIYSDNPDIFSLRDLPESTYYIIEVSLKSNSQETIGKYLVGTPLPVEELEKEIKLTENSDNENYHNNLKETLQWIQSGSSYTIFRKQGKILCLYSGGYKGEIIGEVKDGRITNKPDVKIEDNDNYISLE